MRLTTVAQMALPQGTLHSYAVRATIDPSREVPCGRAIWATVVRRMAS